MPRPGNVPDFGNRERLMKTESSALFEHVKEFATRGTRFAE
jgi:hypothetical protein